MDAGPSERALALPGRYAIYDEIAAGGMATVHVGRVLGDAGFARTVAIKRLHPQYARDPAFTTMLVDEARIAARIHHPNVVTTLNVVARNGELYIVMEYVHGEPLSRLVRAAARGGEKMPPRVVAAVMSGALHGLHAAHEARDERGAALNIVHRDISPQNILVGLDGISRVLDFGIAKGSFKSHKTQEGQIKGKFAYMPPEQLHGEELDRRADVYAAGVVLWEALAGERLFVGQSGLPDLQRLLDVDVEPPSHRVPGLPPGFDMVVMRALGREPDQRYATAREMAVALEACGALAPPSEVSAWVERIAGADLAERAQQIATIENDHAIARAQRTFTSEPDSVPAPPAEAEGSTIVMRLSPRPTSSRPEPAPEDPPPSSAPSVTRPTPEPIRDETTDTTPFERDRAPIASGKVRLAWIGVAAALLGALGLWLVDRASTRAPPAASVPVASATPNIPVPAPGLATGDLQVAGMARNPATDDSPTAGSTPGLATISPPVAASAPGLATGNRQVASATPARAPGAVTASPPRPAPPARPRADACNPPFTIDPEGHKHYKRECL